MSYTCKTELGPWRGRGLHGFSQQTKQINVIDNSSNI